MIKLKAGNGGGSVGHEWLPFTSLQSSFLAPMKCIETNTLLSSRMKILGIPFENVFLYKERPSEWYLALNQYMVEAIKAKNDGQWAYSVRETPNPFIPWFFKGRDMERFVPTELRPVRYRPLSKGRGMELRQLYNITELEILLPAGFKEKCKMK
jgi:hypothetical protein